MIDKSLTGRHISVLRRKLGMTQSALAERLGVSTQAVSKWECGQALPDVDLLLELSWLFGVSINSLLEENIQLSENGALTSLLPERIGETVKDSAQRRLLRAVASYFTEAELAELARQCECCGFRVEVSFSTRDKRKAVDIDLSALSDGALRELNPFAAEAAGVAVADIPREVKRAAEFLVCPECGERLELKRSGGTLTFGDSIAFACPRGHRGAKLVDGVICFDTREIPGEQWSLSLRNYEHYLEWQNAPRNANYKRGKSLSNALWDRLSERRPRVILDIASSMGGGVKMLIEKIDWHCVLIMTDLSYRILAWDKRYFESVMANPNVELIFIACDCAALPLKSESADAVLSLVGFESMQTKRLDGFAESFRVLRDGGAAVYSMELVEDKGSENTAKWLSLLRSLNWLSEKEFAEQYIELDEWLETCMKYGYANTSAEKLYGELPAPDGDTFPFENEIMQWMCRYICVSEK